MMLVKTVTEDQAYDWGQIPVSEAESVGRDSESCTSGCLDKPDVGIAPATHEITTAPNAY